MRSSSRIFEDEGIVLSSTKYLDDSAIVTFAGKEGIRSLLCKRIYRPNSELKPLLIVGNILKVQYTSENEPFIAKSTEIILDCSRLFTSLQYSCLLNLIQEISIALFKYGDAYPTYQVGIIINSMLQGKDPLSLALLFVGSIYKSLGLNENIHFCVDCTSTKNIVSYDLEEGGLLCKECASKKGKRVLGSMSIQVFRFAFMDLNDKSLLDKVVPKDIGKNILVELIDFLISYFDLKNIASTQFFLEIL